MLPDGSLADALVRMVGRVGYDIFADHLKASLAAADVDVSAVAAVRSEATGVALIGVDAAGQNSIIVASGANAVFPAADIEGSSRELSQRAVCAVPVGNSARHGGGCATPRSTGRRQDDPRSCACSAAITSSCLRRSTS